MVMKTVRMVLMSLTVLLRSVNRTSSSVSSQGMYHLHIGSRDGAVVRALASNQCGPGSIPGLGVIWVEFVVGSRPCSEGFSPGTPVFIPTQKTAFPNSNSTWKQWS